MADKINTFQELLDLVQSFNLSRAPAGMKHQHKTFVTMLQHYKYYSTEKTTNDFMRSFEKYYIDYVNKHDIKTLKTKFSAKDSEPTMVKGKYAEYHKEWPGSYKNFQDLIIRLDKFLGSLNGPHKRAIAKLSIHFNNKIDAAGQYNRKLDIVEINPNKFLSTGGAYGSPEYILLHELGHRYLKLHKQKFDINDPKWTTSAYSGKDVDHKKAWPGEERFAELFAMVKWPGTFDKYRDTMREWAPLVQPR